jgi:hypothetical protein
VSACVEPITYINQSIKQGSLVLLSARTDDDVLPELTRENVCLAHLRVCHTARYEHQDPLARLGYRTASTRSAVPARLRAS